MVTRSTSKLINVINEDSDQNSDNTTEIGSVSEKNINPINSKNWKTPSKLYYQRPTAPDLLLEERGENNFKSFSANNIYEWNIDAQTEYNIMNTLQHMTMVATAYQTSHEFKTDLNGKVITNDDDKEIPDAVNTLIFTIAQHFIGDPSLWKDRSAELLSNLKCRTLADFRWYRDTFLTRVYTREDSQQPFWKEKFLAGLPRSLGDKVRDKIRSQSANGDIPYENLSYGQLISYVQKVALKICQDDKIQRQLAKEKAQTKRDLGSFCEQFGLPACPKQKKKQTSRKEAHDHKPANNRRFSKRRYSQKPSTSREIENPKQKIKSKITCYNCGKQGHISKYCRLKKKLRNLNLEPSIEEQINNLLIETSEEETETETSSSVLSDENLNLIQQDDQLSSTDDDGQINTLTREQDLLFEAINSIPDPQEKKVFLEKLKETLEVKPRQKDFITNNKFDVSNILKRLENSSTKPTTIQDLQTEINNLKREVKELRQQQEIHQIILSQLEEDSDSESANNSEENQPENLEDDMFMGADSNCILEGLIPTKFFEKTSEKLSTANGSKLKINFKLSNAIIENQGLRINTNFLLVKNLKNEISNEGITTNYLGRNIIFNFSTKPISRNINFIENKINQINFLKEEVSFNNIQIQLGKPQVKDKIQSLLNHIESTVCSDLPHAFWDRKKHIVDLPYEKDFREKQIPTKARPIQMNEELLQYCQKEIKDLLDKGLIRKDVKNLASKQIFARWQAILSVFDFNIEYIKGSSNSLPDYLTQYWDKNPFKATAKVFPQGFHYRPIAANKTRKFYEFILIDTNSVSIKHFKDPKDPNLNTHSTIQILKVMQPRHYGSNLNQPKKFSAPFDPAGYNYWDYVDAWTNVFWHQNSKFKHSWLIYFKNNTYRYGKTENNKQYPPLQRHAFVKWWSQFDTSKAAPDQVKNWFQSNPEFLKPADPETSLFLNQKSQLAAFLASSKSKESLAQNLKEVLQLLQQEVEEEPSKKEAESSETNDDQEDDPFYQNEDDCFGISLDDD
ncbi:hypothetical protein JHK82_039843 [Glycine max]|nr:hypothetical protein JHK86_040040 [Glycine max]KAG4963173.1 hypothetical protein JHK86_040041 [Glycine max]KAG4965642.1 hypothetical protein JHK85_040617 [Glycine max]KAG4965643.1 hypothetical protein JHK85_040618 [Glycine max]KAG5110619.1 hypothetical protein JHK82_039842 [Glycine max]